jgi:hypothetical protein
MIGSGSSITGMSVSKPKEKAANRSYLKIFMEILTTMLFHDIMWSLTVTGRVTGRVTGTTR